MSYRKLRKAYCRRFGVLLKITLKLKKTDRVDQKLSKKVTAKEIKQALYANKPVMGIIASSKK